MKKVIAVSVLGVAAAVAADVAASLGDAAPMATVKMKAVDGRELPIADSSGAKGTLVMFSCNHSRTSRRGRTGSRRSATAPRPRGSA